MKFTRLKLHGFKSFCDSTELHIESGLTGVVGPNGCGKSNLVEALRWVMGESSYKAMRAAGMDEVIFAGSSNRPSRNTAEVTVVLDNSDRTAPAALNNADTLEVTRRIERESGSVYRVNGREVRARDVQLLFADASTGAHSPALVRQGQISELIAAKPVKRRALLEEAAGISGLHSRRHEAELRLRAAGQNLERVDDIIGQIEIQLETLKRQARLATRYRGLSGEIRKTEATLFHLRWVSSRVAEKEAAADQGRLISELGDATHVERTAQKLVDDTETKMQPLRDEEAVAGAILQRVKILREQLDEDMRRAKARRGELEDRQRQLEADKTREFDLITEATEALEVYQNETYTLNNETDEERKAIDSARRNNEVIQQELINAEQALNEATQALAQLRAKRQQAERSVQFSKSNLTKIHDQIADVDRETEDVRAKLTADESITHSKKELEIAQNAVAEFESATLKAETKTTERQSTLEHERPKLAEAERKLSRLQSEADTLDRILNVAGTSKWQTIVDTLKVSAGYETALGAALGDDLDASVNVDAPLHWAGSLKGVQDAPLPSKTEPLSNYVQGAPQLQRRLDQIGLVSKSDGPTLMHQLSPGQRLVTLEGDFWRWDGFTAAADAPSAAAQRLSQRNRLSDLATEIAKMSSERDRLTLRISALNASLDEARKEQRKLQDLWRNAQHDISRAQSKLDVVQKARANLTNRQSALEEARARLTGSLSEAETTSTEAERALSNAADETEATEEHLQRQNQLTQKRRDSEQARAVLSNLENTTRLRAARQKQIEQEVQSWQRRSKSAQLQLATLEQRATEIASQIEEINATPDGFTDKQQALESQIIDAEARHKTARDTLAVADNENRDASKAVRIAFDVLAQIREKLARVEERLKGAIAQRQQIEQLCQESLDISASRTAELAGLNLNAPLPKQADIERRVDRLKAERQRLGGVNLGAEKEAEEIKGKLEKLIADREDLIAAIAKLRTGISNLNREGRTRLLEAFVTVNAHFQDLFMSLFGGGTAELTFVESDDPLEAGLEIIARPPGKKPQTMTLLSGGEQALTALSLIFAVFLTNPAPICVLDEVDAPLDDANVERFCNLLDTMSSRTDTRFVLITHNPISMSRVDRLFGVTMAERGVSQLVSVDLTTAHAVLETTDKLL